MENQIPKIRMTSVPSWLCNMYVPFKGEIIISTDDYNGAISMRIGDGFHVFSECPEIYMSDFMNFQDGITSFGADICMQISVFEEELLDDVGDII